MRAAVAGVVLTAAFAAFVARSPSPGAAAPMQPPPAAVSSPSPAAAPVPVVYSVRENAQVDLGWTGISHDQPWPIGQRLPFGLVCTAGDANCTVTGGEAGAPFGAPVAISSGGIPVCVVNRMRAPLAGSVNTKSGCGELQLKLTTAVFMGPELARPCPVCTGDVTAHDGKRDGKCSGGATPDAACDAESGNTRFGVTSSGCLPAGDSVGELVVDLLPLTTGTVQVEAVAQCKIKRPGLDDRCFCARQTQPNDCSSGVCGSDEICEEGPVDGVCSKAPYRACRPGSGEAECEAAFEGAGSCEVRTRPCFGDTIAATGVCSSTRPTYVAVMCVPSTRAGAINSSAGLPGPARLALPLERVD